MTNDIIEIAKQTEATVKTRGKDSWENHAVLSVTFTPAQLTKFAELIQARAEITIIENWLTFLNEPIGAECCGRAGFECCGCPEPVFNTAEDLMMAISNRRTELIMNSDYAAMIAAAQKGSDK